MLINKEKVCNKYTKDKGMKAEYKNQQEDNKIGVKEPRNYKIEKSWQMAIVLCPYLLVMTFNVSGLILQSKDIGSVD